MRGWVDPAIFDRILKWNSDRKDILAKWWNHCDINKNGVFILACMSLNVDLVKHVAEVGFTKDHDFLENRSNNVLRAFEIAVEDNESFALSLLDILRKYNVDIPDEFEIYDDDTDDYSDRYTRTIYYENILKNALDGGMFRFATEFSKCDVYDARIVWSWLQRQTKFERT